MRAAVYCLPAGVDKSLINLLPGANRITMIIVELPAPGVGK